MNIYPFHYLCGVLRKEMYCKVLNSPISLTNYAIQRWMYRAFLFRNGGFASILIRHLDGGAGK